MKKLFYKISIILMVLASPHFATAQLIIGVTATPTPDPSHGYCDIVNIRIRVLNNTGSTQSFSGRIRWTTNDFAIVETSELLNFTTTPDGSNTDGTFNIGLITNSSYVDIDYGVVVLAPASDIYDIYHYIHVTGSPTPNVLDHLTLHVKPYKPIFGENTVSEILEATENQNVILSLLPIEALPLSNPDYIACNDDFSQSIYIEDKLFVDIPEYCFYNGQNTGGLIMGTGSSIVVESGSTLRLDGISIRSCDQMWKGIYVEKGAKLIMERCTIANAQYAIEAERGALLDCNNNIFYDNNVGLYVGPYAYAPDPENPENSYVNLTNFRNNDFGGSGQMKENYDGQEPEAIGIPFAGIEIHNLSSFNLPGKLADGHYNTFQNLTNGIVAYNSAIQVGDAFFKRMKRNPSDGRHVDGYGIYIDGGKHTRMLMNGVGTTSEFTHHFYNCETGIYNTEGSIDVDGVTMDSVLVGMECERVTNRQVLLESNNIKAINTGVLLNHCVPRTGLVSDNSIVIHGNGDKSIGIEMNDFPIPLLWRVEFNPITIKEAMIGIHSSSGQRTKIIDNQLLYDSAEEDDRKGINVEGTEGTIVECNFVDGDIELGVPPNYHLGKGINMYLTSNFTVQCNLTQYLRDGIWISTQNSRSFLKGNKLNNNFVGLHLNSDAVIGSQALAGNLWETTSYDFDAVHDAPNNIVLSSRFSYNTNTATGGNVDSQPYPVDGPNNWFYSSGGPLFDCETSLACPTGIGSISDFVSWDSLDYKLINGNLGFPHYDRCLSWTGRFHSYKHLRNAASTVGWPSLITTFLSTHASLNIGKFSNAYDSLYSALYYTGTYEQTLDDYRDSVNAIYTRITVLDDLLWDDRDNGTISELLTDEYENIFIYECDFREKDSLINLILMDRVDNAISYIESISPDSIWQEALKFTLLEYLNYAKNDTLLSPIDLEELAESCPEKYGNPVFHARSLLRAEADKSIYDNNSLCGFITPREFAHETAISSTLNPNPSNSTIEISAPLEISSISVFAVDGSLLKLEYSLIDNKAIADASSLPNGLYICQITLKDKSIEVLKFNVIH